MEAFSSTSNISAKSVSNLASKDSSARNQLVLRIPKLPLVVRFDKDLAEILEVEEKASISESYRFFLSSGVD